VDPTDQNGGQKTKKKNKKKTHWPCNSSLAAVMSALHAVKLRLLASNKQFVIHVAICFHFFILTRLMGK
jgi:hypothetical protein